MTGIPIAIPLAWTKPGAFFLQSLGFGCEIGSDCLRYRRNVR